MPTSQVKGVVQQLRNTVLRQEGAGLTDGQLLGCFIEQRDEAAFAALVRRHGPMVWGVCRRLLQNYHDAEDAFQATFLVLVRKAASVLPREMVGNWLYGVANQTALKARARNARRRTRERQVTEMPEPGLEPDLWDDLQPLLDQELRRLPDRYRAVVVLCDLEGKTRKEAARQLGCPEGTVASRLATARTMLAKRLAQRGVTLSCGALAAVLFQKAASARLPTPVVSSTIKAASLLAAGQAAGVVSARVAALTEGVMKVMFVTKIKSVLAVVLVAGLTLGGIGAGIGLYTNPVAVAQQASAKQDDAKKPDDKEKTISKNAKTEQKVLTPEEATKHWSEVVTVQFKVASTEETNAGVVTLMDENGRKGFQVLLSRPIRDQIIRLGIEPTKYFNGKVIRATGAVQRLVGLGGRPFWIVVDDLKQFEVVR